MLPEYTFISWLRQGLAAEIAEDDTLGTDIDAGALGRATLPVELTLDTIDVDGNTPAARPAVKRNVSILGPGDVAAIKQEAVVRTQPANGALAATPGELAFVEFYDEDFPWRYTPARAKTEKLRPWIALLVLTDVEFTLRERDHELPVLQLTERAVLPPYEETWAWAHAQLSSVVTDATKVDATVRANRDLALSRLMCPRRLLPETAYHAFVVPAFETGRLAGLGHDASQTHAQRPAWGTPAHKDDSDLPIYLSFAFTTGTTGDFETLARLLVPAPVGEAFGKRRMDVSQPGYGMKPRVHAEVELEGALAPPEFDDNRAAFPDSPGQDVANDLEAIVDSVQRRIEPPVSSGDPVVVPPIYGRWHAGVPSVADATSDLGWLVELNLDLRERAAAGLGAEVVRQRDEEYVQRAWEQIGEVEAANQRLREAELARGAGDAIMRKHVAQAGDGDRILVLTSGAHAGLSVPDPSDTTSIRGAVDASRVPVAAEAPAFRRITRPQRPLMRRLTDGADLTRFQRGLLTNMNKEAAQALSAAPPAPDPAAGVKLQDVRDAVADSVSSLAGKQDRADRVFLELLETELSARLQSDPQLDLNQLDEVALGESVKQRVETRYPPNSTAQELALGERVKTLAGAISDVRADPPGAAVQVAKTQFEDEFGKRVAGKAYRAVTVLNQTPPAGVTDIARVTDLGDAQSFATSLGTFDSAVVGARHDPAPPGALDAPATLADHVLASLAPARTLGERVAKALPILASRPAGDPRRLDPVMAHPEFPDPLFEPLVGLSQDYVIPNVADLPRNALTLMEPNRRFIEAFLAGVNHAFAQELLWREYPTDQRGTYFKVFWDALPASDDIKPLHEWKGDLGAQSALAAGVLVLVVRGDLLEKYPRTAIYAQRAAWPGGDTIKPRVLATGGEVRQPILQARLEPDITLVGFVLGEDEARGRRPQDPGTGPVDPGWFFVFMERPGEARFGLDDSTPTTGMKSWNDLGWDSLTFPKETPNIEITANAALAPTVPQTAQWGRTAADMAGILFQSPVLLARHASEMLP